MGYTVELAIVSFIERLSSLWRLKCTSIIEKEPLLCPLWRFYYRIVCFLIHLAEVGEKMQGHFLRLSGILGGCFVR